MHPAHKGRQTVSKWDESLRTKGRAWWGPGGPSPGTRRSREAESGAAPAGGRKTQRVWVRVGLATSPEEPGGRGACVWWWQGRVRVVVAGAAGEEVLVIPGDGGELRKGLEGREHMLLAHRLVIVVLIGVSVAWIPVLQDSNSGQLFIYMQSVTSSLAPPVTALFVLGIFWPRANEQGAFWGLMVGLAVGTTRLVLEFLHPAPRCGDPDTRPAILGSIHYLHFAVALFLLSGVVVVAGSLLTPPPHRAQIENLTWWTLARDVLKGAKTGDGRVPQKHAFWARVCGFNAILLICVNIFFYAYFA